MNASPARAKRTLMENGLYAALASTVRAIIRFNFFRPQSLAWAVRKLSPGKNVAPSPPPVFATEKTKNAMRSLGFESEEKIDGNVISWADRVKGKTTVSCESSRKKQVIDSHLWFKCWGMRCTCILSIL